MKKSALSALAALAAAAVCAAPGELVPNGSFEEGTAVTLPTWARTGYTLLSSAGTASWTGAGYITVNGGAGHHFLTQPVPNGIYALALTKAESAQTEVTIPASGQYVVSWYAVAAWTNLDFKAAGHVVGAYLDDDETPLLSSTQDTPDEWKKHSAVVTLQAGVHTLWIKGTDMTAKAASIIDCVSILPYSAPSGEATRTIGGTEYVYLLEDYNIAAYTSGSCWSDGAAPSAEKAYLVADGLSLGTEYHSRTFPGGSLRVGAEGSEGHLVFSDRNTANANATATMGDVTLAAGSIDTFSAVHTYSRSLALAGTYTVTATRSAPFRIRGKNNHPGVTCRFGISGAVSGGDDACLVIEGLYDESAGGGGFQYNGANGTYTAAEQPLRDYTGRIILDGTNTTYYVYWHSGMPNGGGVYWFGAPPAAYMADAFTLRNGAKLSFEDTYWANVLETPNRGMTVENGGAIHLKSGDGGGVIFGIDVAGTGTLTLAGTVTGKGKILFNSTLAADAVDFSSGKFFLGQDFALGAGTAIRVASEATLVVSANGLAPSNAVIEADATIIAGVGNGAEFVSGQQTRVDGSKMSYARPRNYGYGCLTLSDSSSLSLPVTLALESAITLGGADRFPVLKVPTSVATVTPADFTVASGEVQVETAPDGLQTVYLTRTSASTVAYVVPEGTPGVDPTPPYDSWATAATNIQDAVDASSADGVVKILAGRYPLASQVSVPVALRIASCAATDDETPDREGTVIDAQGLGRCFYCTADNTAFVGLTLANGAVDSSASKGGGVYFDKGFCALYDCIVTNCSAKSGGGVCLEQNNSRLFLEGTRFVDCSAATAGGGAWWWANIGWNGSDFPTARYSQTTILDCQFIRCTASSGEQGGGIKASMNGDFWAERCLFQDCQILANNGSGAAFWANNWTTLIDCVVDGCATKNRSVIYCGAAGKLRMEDSVVRGTRAGSAVIDGQASVLFTRCAFTNNNVALLSKAVADTFRNCLFSGNAQPLNVYDSACENCTFAGNPAGGLSIDAASRRPVFVNCVSAANGDGANLVFASGVDASGVVLTNCCIEGAAADVLARDPTGASFARAPRFVGAAAGDYRPSIKSPLREAALPLGWMVPGSTDLDGSPRLVSLRGKPFAPGALPDIGCYECQERKALGTVVFMR